MILLITCGILRCICIKSLMFFAPLWLISNPLYGGLRGVDYGLQPSLKRQCSTVIKLLCGISVLNAHKNVNIPRHARTCAFCHFNDIEDAFHLVVRCTLMADLRMWLYSEMVHSLSQDCLDILHGLSDIMILNILMGLQFPFSVVDLYRLRKVSCVAIHKMYIRRKTYEPP